MLKYKIAIDAGHGSDTAGKRTPPFTSNVSIHGNGIIDIKKGEQFREHYASVGVANLLYNKLKSRGYTVIKTGWDDANSKDDIDEALSSRQKKIKKENCDISVSLHFNAYGNGNEFNSAEGVGIYIHSTSPATSRYLAEFVLNGLMKGSLQINRGITSAQLALCNCDTMKTNASILCELAYMTNKKEAMLLMANSRFWEETAEKIADAIDSYYSSHTVEEIASNHTATLIHTIVAGETLSKIAGKYNIAVDQIVKLNKIKNPNIIAIGQKIIVSKYLVYTVKNGDTLSALSQKYLGDATKFDKILAFNGLKSNEIHVNQVLKIPV